MNSTAPGTKNSEREKRNPLLFCCRLMNFHRSHPLCPVKLTDALVSAFLCGKPHFLSKHLHRDGTLKIHPYKESPILYPRFCFFQAGADDYSPFSSFFFKCSRPDFPDRPDCPADSVISNSGSLPEVHWRAAVFRGAESAAPRSRKRQGPGGRSGYCLFH